jgi:hypothetical protein
MRYVNHIKEQHIEIYADNALIKAIAWYLKKQLVRSESDFHNIVATTRWSYNDSKKCLSVKTYSDLETHLNVSRILSLMFGLVYEIPLDSPDGSYIEKSDLKIPDMYSYLKTVNSYGVRDV